MTTGQRIRDARKKVGMTQTELAQKLNIPFQSISQWERNLRNPKFDTIQRIADALAIHPFDLMGIDEEMRQHEISIAAGDEIDEPTLHAVKEILNEDPRSLYDKLSDEQKTEFWGILMKPLSVQLQESFDKLNSEGQDIAVQRIQELCKIPKYQRKQSPDIPEVPPEDRK